MPSDVSALNASFWSEPCGTQLANSLGILGEPDEHSLRIFDTNYFELYPYLQPFLSDVTNSASRVLEVGLGMGSLSEWLANHVDQYIGLDIAEGPVQIVNQRLMRSGKPQSALRGSITEAPFPDNYFDAIVAVGSLHHTGALKKSIEECHRILVPGGNLKLMVYYAYSARRWAHKPFETFGYLLQEAKGYRGVVDHVSADSRASYDVNSRGEAAPHTDFISRKSLKQYCSIFKSAYFEIKNFESEGVWKHKSRNFWLNTKIPSVAGLDLYASFVKG